ncbi:MAG: hypothetical protein J3R72DRAFT_477135 [Linnemannia gamsii]|nr:MAG: hypothetical protein J3R72DRAFT_477135 [Linnemannia gamsii]
MPSRKEYMHTQFHRTPQAPSNIFGVLSLLFSFVVSMHFQAVRPVLHNGLSAFTGEVPTDADVTYIETHPDPFAGMEIVLWNDIRMMFKDVVYVRHNSKTLLFLKGGDSDLLTPHRITALPYAVLEVVVLSPSPRATPSPSSQPPGYFQHQQSPTSYTSTPQSPSISPSQNRDFTPQFARPIPPTTSQPRPPPAIPRVIPQPPPVIPRAVPRPPPSTARGTIKRIAPNINLGLLPDKGEWKILTGLVLRDNKKDF